MFKTSNISDKNNMLGIIKSYTRLTNSIIDIINEQAKIQTKHNTLHNIESYKEIINCIYGDDGFLSLLIKEYDKTTQIFKSIKINNSTSENINNRVDLVIHSVMTTIRLLKRLNAVTADLNLEDLNKTTIALNKITEFTEIINNIRIKTSVISKLRVLKRALRIINKNIIGNLIFASTSAKLVQLNGIQLIENHINTLINIVNTINSINFFQYMMAKKDLEELKEMIPLMNDVLTAILGEDGVFSKNSIMTKAELMAKLGVMNVALKGIAELLIIVEDMDFPSNSDLRDLQRQTIILLNVTKAINVELNKARYGGWKMYLNLGKLAVMGVMFYILSYIFNIISDTKTLFIKGKLKVIYNSLFNKNGIFDILSLLIEKTYRRQYKTYFNVIGKLVLIAIIFKILSRVMWFASLSATASLLYVIFAIPFKFAINITTSILKVIIEFSKRIKPRDILSTFKFLTLLSMLGMVAISLALISITAKSIIANYGYIVLFIAGLIPIIFELTILGFVVTAVATIAAPAIIGLFAVSGMIVGVCLTALGLRALMEIQLDKDVIKDNVETVMDSAKYIITSLFDDDVADEMAENIEDSNSNGVMGIVKGIFSTSSVLLQAILSSVVIALTFLSVTLIIFITLELRLLQEITLDRDKILTNVSTVLDTSKFIIDCLFGDKYYDEKTNQIEYNPDQKRRTWLGNVFANIGAFIDIFIASFMLFQTLLSISFILLIATELSALKNIDLSPTTIKDNIKNIMDTAKMVIDVMNAPSETKKENKDDGIIGKILDFVLPDNLKYAIDAIVTMGFLAVTMVSIGAIGFIAKQLMTIQDLPKLDKVKDNTEIIVSTCKTVIDIISTKKFDKDIIDDQIGVIKSIKRLTKQIIKLTELDMNNADFKTDKIKIADFTLAIMDEFEKITNVKAVAQNKMDKLIGMLKDFKRLMKITDEMSGFELGKIIANKQSYIDYIDTINDIIIHLKPKGVGIAHLKKGKRLNKQVELFGELCESISQTQELITDDVYTFLSNIKSNKHLYFDYIDTVNKIIKKLNPKGVGLFNLRKNAKLNKQIDLFIDLNKGIKIIQRQTGNMDDNVYNSFKNYTKVINGVFKMIRRIDKVNMSNITVEKSNLFKQILENVYGSLPEIHITTEDADNIIRVTDNYIKFTEKINTVNIKKLETTANMFGKMAEFSKSINGNFEKLAESLNEDLMPVLEELKDTLNKIPEKIDTNAASVSQSVAATAGIQNQPSTHHGMTAQVRRENPNMSTEDVKRVVDNRLNEQARAQSQSLESKFDELIELLKSGLARVTLT